jgi:hypothetical protein
MPKYYVLDNHGEPRREPDVEAWSRWFERADRRIARTVVSADVTVLTTFIGVDEGDTDSRPPRLYGTRVFGGVLNGEDVLSASREESIEAHDELVEWCRIGNAPGAGVREDQIR